MNTVLLLVISAITMMLGTYAGAGWVRSQHNIRNVVDTFDQSREVDDAAAVTLDSDECPEELR